MMATKKQNRRHTKRRVRRALNQALDFFKAVSGRRVNRIGYGTGISRRDLQQRIRDDE